MQDLLLHPLGNARACLQRLKTHSCNFHVLQSSHLFALARNELAARSIMQSVNPALGRIHLIYLITSDTLKFIFKSDSEFEKGRRYERLSAVEFVLFSVPQVCNWLTVEQICPTLPVAWDAHNAGTLLSGLRGSWRVCNSGEPAHREATHVNPVYFYRY